MDFCDGGRVGIECFLRRPLRDRDLWREGAGGASLRSDEGVDTFITGEGPQWTFAMAEELGLNVFYGGHYATETFGVKALAAHLSDLMKAWTPSSPAKGRNGLLRWRKSWD